MKSSLVYVLFILLAVGLVSCADEPKNDSIVNVESNGEGKLSIDINTDPENIEKAAEKLGSRISESISNIDIDFSDKDGEKVEVVNFRALKKMLPNAVGNAERTDAKGQRSGMFGINIAQAEGKYRSGNQTAEVNIVDIGGVGLAINSFADWSKMEIDNESDDGYERTIKIAGHPAYVKWSERNQNGEIAVIVGNRFVVNVKGDNLTMDDLEDALDEIDLDDLEDLI